MPVQRKLSDADRVWNRACFREGKNLRNGDRALESLLLIHGYIMNGGVGHAFELEPQELAQGIAGYEFFGLHELATVIKPHSGLQEAEFNSRYDALGGRDEKLIARFKEVYDIHPELFAPLDAT